MPTINYIWDEQNYLAETDENNVVQTVYTNEPEQYGNLISSRISGTTSYRHFDGIGSTRQLTNAAGTVTDTVIYDAWGNVVSRTGTTATAFLWIAEVEYYIDVELRLANVRRRMYAPLIARWTARDPLQFVSALFPLTYVANSPVALLDPSGLHFEDTCTCDAFRRSKRQIRKGRCPIDITCGNCGASAGTTSGTPRLITICLDRGEHTRDFFERLLLHELVHAAQICRGQIINDCDSCLRLERLAYIKSCTDWLGDVSSDADYQRLYQRCLNCGRFFSCNAACGARAADVNPRCRNEDIGLGERIRQVPPRRAP